MLAGKLAVVTGASRGIGAEVARLLSSAGARLVITARHEDALRHVAGSLKGPALVVPADLRDQQSTDRLIAETEAHAGIPDIVVNIAGVWHNQSTLYQGPRLWETPTEQIAEVLDVGLHGAFRVARGFLPAMVKRGAEGHVVQIGCGFAGAHEAVGWLHYYVANRALAAFTEGLAAELRPHKIRVNCVAPWFVATDYVRQFYPEQSKTALLPTRVADVIVALLAGPMSLDVSGQVIELRSDSEV
ncbi:MAG: SDR family oxidoreductase [Vicinamibacterales bacterium]